MTFTHFLLGKNGKNNLVVQWLIFSVKNFGSFCGKRRTQTWTKKTGFFFPPQLKREKENRYFIAGDLSHHVTETTTKVVWLIR